MRMNLFAALGVVAGAALSASAGVVSLTMQNGNGGGFEFNTTAFSITNLSDSGVGLTQVTFTVGDTQCLFDFLYSSEEQFNGGNGSESATLLVGDRSDDNAGPDFFTYGFDGFPPGTTFRGQWDIDYDNLNYNVDMRRVFFNNGDAPNAVVSLIFSDGTTASYEFPDLPVTDSYSIQIPGPAAWPLAAAGTFAILRRRR
ncbi:MAG: hypothetical protein NTV94_14540 [Planctomycetota bacterium]|nr:hypothetical protein [Planctomycetota bacterium]